MKGIIIIFIITLMIGQGDNSRLDRRFDNKTLQAAVGKEVVLEMEGNATTGYGWYLLTKTDKFSKSLKPLNLDEYGSSNDYVTNPHPEGFVGVPGRWFFKFMPNEKRTVKLEFEYKQPWMPTPENRADRNISEITLNIE